MKYLVIAAMALSLVAASVSATSAQTESHNPRGGSNCDRANESTGHAPKGLEVSIKNGRIDNGCGNGGESSGVVTPDETTDVDDRP